MIKGFSDVVGMIATTIGIAGMVYAVKSNDIKESIPLAIAIIGCLILNAYSIKEVVDEVQDNKHYFDASYPCYLHRTRKGRR